jgi:hypothetical protein
MKNIGRAGHTLQSRDRKGRDVTCGLGRMMNGQATRLLTRAALLGDLPVFGGPMLPAY